MEALIVAAFIPLAIVLVEARRGEHLLRRQRWMTREEREKVCEGIAEAGSALAWMRQAAKPKPLTEEDRARRAAVNAVADKFGFPRPYADLDEAPLA